jgi:hypothetical protein
VLPPMMIGEPPSYRAIIAEQVEPEVTVAWQMLLNDRPLGWAKNTTRRRQDGVTDMDSRVHFDRLPLAEVAPPWLRSLTLPIQEAASLGLEAESKMEIDPLGHLIGFRSAVHLGEIQNVGIEFCNPAGRHGRRRVGAAGPLAQPACRPDLDRADVQPAASAQSADRSPVCQGRA